MAGITRRKLGQVGNGTQSSRRARIEYLESRNLLTAVALKLTDATMDSGVTSSETSPAFVAFTDTLNGTAVTRVYFAANDGVNGTELWKTNSKPGGTSMAANINPNSGANNGSRPQSLVTFTGADGLSGLYMIAQDNSTLSAVLGDREVWRWGPLSANANSQLMRVKDIAPGTARALNPPVPTSLNPSAFAGWVTDSSGLTVVGDWLYFAANDGSGGLKLWKSNGVPVADAAKYPGYTPSVNAITQFVAAASLQPTASTVSQITAVHNGSNWEAHFSDGSKTYVSVNGGPYSKVYARATGSDQPSQLTEFHDDMLFATRYSDLNPSTVGTYVRLASDGTDYEKKLNESSGAIFNDARYYATEMQVSGDVAYFVVQTTNTVGTSGDDWEVWSYYDNAGDGLAPDAALLGSFEQLPSNLTNYNGQLYFNVGSTLYKANGNDNNPIDGVYHPTLVASDVMPSPSFTAISDIQVVGSQLYLSAATIDGAKIWVSTNGTNFTAVHDTPAGGTLLSTAAGRLYFRSNVDNKPYVVRNAVPGDANLDGVVNGADYTIWATNYLKNPGTQTWQTGDFTDDGNVDGADYTLWAVNFLLKETDPTPASVPLVPNLSAVSTMQNAVDAAFTDSAGTNSATPDQASTHGVAGGWWAMNLQSIAEGVCSSGQVENYDALTALRRRK